MKMIKVVLLAFTMMVMSQAMATGDCSVGYAHMQNGKFKQAYSEFRGLAERGYPVYMNIIGDMHLKGQGVPASQMKAHVWYSLSAAQDNAKGISSKEKLAQSLNKEQLSSSKVLAKKYAQDYLEPYVAGWSL